MTQFQDVTSEGMGLPATDRLYDADGRRVKVRVLKDVPPAGAPSFGVAYLRVSGSECDADGWTLPQVEGGYRIAPAEVHTIMYDSAVDFPGLLETLRQECVGQTLRAADLQDQIDAMIGG